MLVWSYFLINFRERTENIIIISVQSYVFIGNKGVMWDLVFMGFVDIWMEIYGIMPTLSF